MAYKMRIHAGALYSFMVVVFGSHSLRPPTTI